jgi:signal transduction histidine kinase
MASVSVALRVFAAGVLLIVAAASYYELRASRRAVISDTERQMSRLDMVFAEQTGRAVEAVDLLVSGALETVQLRILQGSGMGDVDDTLRRRIRGVRQLTAITVVDASGKVLASTESDSVLAPPGSVQALLSRYRDNPKIGLLIGAPFRVSEGKWNALLARPMLDSEGQLLGVAFGSIALSYFEDFYRAVELSENGAINLHLRDGTVLARFPHVDNIIGTSFGTLPPFKEVLANAMSGTLLMDSPVDGSTRVVAIRALRAFPLAVMVSVEQRRILVDWRHGAFALICVAIVMGGAVVVLLLSLSRRSRQVELLLEESRTARTVAEQAKDRLLQQISERERAEGALRQAQRIEAIGQLTGGVAHDFNNLLTVVLGNVDILQRRELNGDRSVASRLMAIRSAAERGATLTGHLLAFARRQPLMPKAVDLNVTVRGMRDLLDSAIGMRARVELRLSDDLWPAMVDQCQIELVILNLVINARDAMPMGGNVTIETCNHRRTESAAPDAPPVGDYVRVTVRDTGVGMPPEVLARVFEPFFTTKAPGSGSGLGLSQVFGTARQSGGEVRIESAVGCGTAVHVDLPRATLTASRVPEVRRATQVRGTSATVLLVDDDEPVRAVTTAMLRELGYNVREAASGEEALRALSQDIGTDVLLTDLVMPGMNGSQLAIAARSLHADLPVIFVSGYAEQLGDALMLDHRLVRKPFGSPELYQAIEAVLGERRMVGASVR